MSLVGDPQTDENVVALLAGQWGRNYLASKRAPLEGHVAIQEAAIRRRAAAGNASAKAYLDRATLRKYRDGRTHWARMNLPH